jgi:CRISPR/Cas system-associated exonuclease Cas4 (RecB family)
VAKLTTKLSIDTSREAELENALKGQFNLLHNLNYYDDYEIEKMLLRQKEYEVSLIKKRPVFPEGLVRFSPSGADKCRRELFYKACKMPQDEQPMYPYQKRWTRNSTGVHEAVQRDLLYMEKHLLNPSFKVDYVETAKGLLPAWEKNIQQFKIIEHNGVKFVLFGMMDGILNYKDGSKIGFEFKTKSVMPDRVQKLKKASRSHIQQTVAYSLLFGIDEYLLTYESVAKDEWKAGPTAYDDLNLFYQKVTDRQKKALLDKFSEVASMYYEGEVPKQETSKCMFCPFKTTCLGGQ